VKKPFQKEGEAKVLNSHISFTPFHILTRVMCQGGNPTSHLKILPVLWTRSPFPLFVVVQGWIIPVYQLPDGC
jgi:hypothetical protein